jgi:hypothetical protein
MIIAPPILFKICEDEELLNDVKCTSSTTPYSEMPEKMERKVLCSA